MLNIQIIMTDFEDSKGDFGGGDIQIHDRKSASIKLTNEFIRDSKFIITNKDLFNYITEICCDNFNKFFNGVKDRITK